MLRETNEKAMQNEEINKGIRNVKYTFLAQIIVMGSGILKTLLIPSFLSIESYGYWQIYLFYISYIGFFYLGFNDGVLLKYGKYDYDKLPFPIMRISMRFYLAMLVLFSLLFSFYANTILDIEKNLVMSVIAASILMYGINGVLVYIFLITNQIKLYSFFTSMDQIVILGAVIIMMLFGSPDYRILVAVSFISKLILVIIMVCLCRDLFWGKVASAEIGFREFVDNIRCGLVLMLAQIMSMLLTGLGKVFVEYFGNIEEYAYYSFGMSIINIVMVCVIAIATVMYPMLSRIDGKDLPGYFNIFCSCVTFFNAIAVIAYFPAAFFVKILFPRYAPILEYLFILFALLTWQAKVNIVTNPYFRVLRKERQMFKINAMGVSLFIIVSFPAILLTHSIKVIAICTFITILFIELISELYLRGQLKLKISSTTAKDMMINGMFIISCSFFELLPGFIIYAVFVIVYLVIDRKIVIDFFKKIL